jgi:hypothetical protein
MLLSSRYVIFNIHMPLSSRYVIFNIHMPLSSRYVIIHILIHIKNFDMFFAEQTDHPSMQIQSRIFKKLNQG